MDYAYLKITTKPSTFYNLKCAVPSAFAKVIFLKQQKMQLGNLHKT